MTLPVEKTKYEHVALDAKGVPMIVGTNTKVIEIVVEKSAYGWSPEELFFQHPHLSLGQIYSALAYYWDHQDELDKDIAERLAIVKQTRKSAEQSPLTAKLKSKGLI